MNSKETIDKLSKEIDTVRTVLSRVDNYRRNVFTQLKDKESVDRILNNIRICRIIVIKYINNKISFNL